MTARAASSALLAAALLGGCATGGEGAVVIAVDISALTGPAADPGSPMQDDLGLADLSRYPVVIVARIEADDLDVPVASTWPETVSEGTPEVVELDLEVEPGSDRRVSVELIVADETAPAATFVSPLPGRRATEVEVTAGETTDVELEVSELDTATVRAVVPADGGVVSVAWVDDHAGAVLPPAAVEGGVVDVDLSVGRRYWPRVYLSDGTSIVLDTQTVQPEAAGVPVTVDIELD